MGHQLENSEFDLSAASASADDLFDLGIRYCLGQHVEQDLVKAHTWFNIAALKGSDSARQYRREISREMSPSQIAHAQRQARDWLTLH